MLAITSHETEYVKGLVAANWPILWMTLEFDTTICGQSRKNGAFLLRCCCDHCKSLPLRCCHIIKWREKELAFDGYCLETHEVPLY